MARKLGSVFVALLIGIMVLHAYRPEWFASSTRQILFINGSDEPRTARVDGQTVEVKPHQVGGCLLNKGRYTVDIATASGAARSVALVVDHPTDAQKNDHIWVDLEGTGKYALINATALYKGGGFFAAHMANAVQQAQARRGGNRLIWSVYDGAKPFSLELSGQVEVADPFQRIPEKVAVGTAVFKLIRIERVTNDADLLTQIATKLGAAASNDNGEPR